MEHHGHAEHMPIVARSAEGKLVLQRSRGLPESDDGDGHGHARPGGVTRGRRPTPSGNRPRVRCPPLDRADRRGGAPGPRDRPARGARSQRHDGAGDASAVPRRPRPCDSRPDPLADDPVLGRFPPSGSRRTQLRSRSPRFDHCLVRRRSVLPGRCDRAPCPHGRHGRPREPRGPLGLPVQRGRDLPIRGSGLLLGGLDPRALPPLPERCGSS